MPHWREQWQRQHVRGGMSEREQDRAALRTLGLDSSAHATSDEIKERYRELAQRWHPDRHTGARQKAAAEVQFKKVGQAFANLQRRLPVGHELITIDPFHGVPWYHYTRYPPWSFARGPPYAPSGVWCTFMLAVAAALLYDAANPAFGERRLQRLMAREAEAQARRQAAREAKKVQANEMSRVARDHLQASLEAALASKNTASESAFTSKRTSEK
eukprot:CAMPEP_0119322996 /NCGR_PEP_ID=MMETSP1333-20130426/59688_1 /TAXON_ID=418940 /ORGANISM="Scyphosphaera apsteinii, Strain RCC1455" /LENGTH=214 /DNA_ID=CAMNT_0007330347 /DNA_START=155 /DNA_END=799 /DNA_ORIENTATION=-